MAVTQASAATATIVEYAVAGSTPNGIVAGPDGNLWFTDAGHDSIDRFTTGGTATIYPLPTATPILARSPPVPVATSGSWRATVSRS
jgi:streptogramin lyase